MNKPDYNLLNSLLADGSPQSLLKIKCVFDVKNISLERIQIGFVVTFLNIHFDYYKKWFENNSLVITCISYCEQDEVIDMFRKSFEEGFKNNPRIIRYVNNTEQIKLLNVFRKSFSIGFKNNPEIIRYISPQNRDKVKKLFPDIDFPS